MRNKVLTLFLTLSMLLSTVSLSMSFAGTSDTPANDTDKPLQLVTSDESIAAYRLQEFIAPDLKKQIDSYTKKYGIPEYSVYVKDLTYGASFEYKTSDKLFIPASIAKIFVAHAVIQMISDGEIKGGFNYVIKDKVTKTNTTVLETLRSMLIVSDNNSYNHLIREFGPKRINDKLKGLSLEGRIYGEFSAIPDLTEKQILERNKKLYGTEIEGGLFTAKDISKIFESVYKLKESNYNFKVLNSIMTECKTGPELIKASVSKDIAVAHKTGSWPSTGTWVDAGIVYDNNVPYVIVILNEKAPSKIKARTFVADVAKIVYTSLLQLFNK